MPTMEWAWLIPALSFIAFPIIAIFGRFLPGKGSFLAILAIAAGFVLFWFVAMDRIDQGATGVDIFSHKWFDAGSVTLTWGIIVDPLTVVMLGLVTFVALMVQVYSLGYMKGDPRFGWYFAVHAFFAASMLALVLADNFLLLYVAWELVGLCSYLLIGFWYERRSAAEAAKKAFITTRIADVALLVGILLLFKELGTFSMSETFHQAELLMAGGESLLSTGTATAAALLLFVGAMGKSAQVPFHVWLPDAMEGPTPVSALIHAATMVVAGVFLVARTFALFEAAPDALLVVAIVGLVTTLMTATMALVATDLKRILAYSTVSHLGLMMLSLGAFGYTAAIFHLIAHGFSKALLFLGAGNVMHGADQTDIRKHGRTGKGDASHCPNLCHWRALSGWHTSLCRVLEQGRNPAIGLGTPALDLHCLHHAGGVPERLVHGPSLLCSFYGQAQGAESRRPRGPHYYDTAHGAVGRHGGRLWVSCAGVDQ